MKTFDVPDWMVGPFVTNGVSENDYYLYGAGRALGFARMAAYALDDPNYDTETIGHPLKVAEYHAYTGISAARTAIDATASWCNVVLNPNPPNGVGRALEQDITGMGKGPSRRIRDMRGQ